MKYWDIYRTIGIRCKFFFCVYTWQPVDLYFITHFWMNNTKSTSLCTAEFCSTMQLHAGTKNHATSVSVLNSPSAQFSAQSAHAQIVCWAWRDLRHRAETYSVLLTLERDSPQSVQDSQSFNTRWKLYWTQKKNLVGKYFFKSNSKYFLKLPKKHLDFQVS